MYSGKKVESKEEGMFNSQKQERGERMWPLLTSLRLLSPRTPPDDNTGRWEPYEFLFKLDRLLNDRDTDGVISWNDIGSTFIVHQPFVLERDLLSDDFFGRCTFSAFVNYLTTRIGFVKTGGRCEFFKEGFRRKERDGYMWRKAKTAQSNNARRECYVCAVGGCSARKEVTTMTDLDGKIADVIYEGNHSHPKPPPDKLVLPLVHQGVISADLSSALGTRKCSDSSAVESDCYSSVEDHSVPESSLRSVEEDHLSLPRVQKSLKGNCRNIPPQSVVTRNPSQVASHASNYFSYQSIAASRHENWNEVVSNFGGKSHCNLKPSEWSSVSNNDCKMQELVKIMEVQGAHTVGSAGRKDRYSKIFTAQGVKDHRIRLSVHTAIRIYDLQDRLGYDTPSKALDWLIKKSAAAIYKFPELPAWEPSANSATKTRSAATSQSPQCVEEEPQKIQQQQESQKNGCGSWWDFNSSVDSFAFQHQLNPSTGYHPTLIPFSCKPIDLQGTRPHLTFLQGPAADIKEVQDGNIFGSTASKDSHSKVFTAKGFRDRCVRLPVHTAIQFYDLQDCLGYDRPSKAVDWLIEAAKAAIDELAELCAPEPSDAKQSAGASQPPQHKEEGPRKSQHQQETHPSGFGSGWDFRSLADFFAFQHQLDPSDVHRPGSSFVLPTLNSDTIADFIKFFRTGSSCHGGDSATVPSQNLFQSHPVPEYIEEVQNMLCMSRITKNDLDADSMTRILGMSKLKVHNLFSKVPKPLPSIFQADTFVELHLPHYNHRLLWAGKLALVNLRLINLKRSLKLISLPDLSMAQKIVHLNLRGCVKLIQVSCIRNLAKLEELDMSNCENIRILPSLIGLQNLREFYLSGCSNLSNLPPSIRALNNLVVLDLKNCAQLYELPSITSGLRSLQKLDISGCTKILRSLDMKGSRGSHHSYGRLLSNTVSGKNGYSSSTGKASEFVDGVASHEQKKCTTKKAKKNSAPEVVQVEVSEERELTIKNFNWTAATKMEEDERKSKSVESTAKTSKEVRVKRSCNNLDYSVSSICQPSHEPEAVEKFSDGQSRESKLIDSSVPAYRSSAVLGCGHHILTGSAPESVEEAIIDSGSKLIGDTQPAPTDPAPTLNKSTFTRTAVEDSTSRDGKDVGLGIQMQLEAISLGNSGLQPLEECTEKLALDVSKAVASCDPHKSAEKLRDGGNKSNSEVFNHQPKETESLASYEENGESDWLKEEIQKLQEQLAASEKRREGICEHYDSLESELWPLRAELEVEHVNLKEQKQRHEEREQEASVAWEDLKKLVAEVAFDYDTIF